MSNFDFQDAEIQEFKTEALDLLDAAEKNLLSIDKGGSFGENFDAIFRAFHSIKGAAGMLGMTDLQNHMHHVETHFQQCKTLPSLNKAQCSYFLNSIDAAREVLDQKSIQFDYGAFSVVGTAATEASDKNISSHQSKVEVRAHEKNGVIYVIDDEPDIAQLIEEILVEDSFEVVKFNKPKKAIDELKKRKPDVVFTDMKMPEMTGMDILKSVEAIDPDIPVVFVSGYLDKATIIEAISHGVYGVVEKPFKASQILSLCRSASDQHQTTKLLNKSINFMMYQFSDLSQFLKETGKESLQNMMEQDLKSILETRRKLKRLKARN